MQAYRIYLRKVIFFQILILFIACQGSIQNPNPESVEIIKTLSNKLDLQDERIQELERKLISYESVVMKHSNSINNDMEENKIIDEIKINLEDIKNFSIEKDFIIALNKLQKKNQILEDRSLYADSLYFAIMYDIVNIENQISSILSTSRENVAHINTIKTEISAEEYNAKYIESLANFQNSEWNLSLKGFNYLIQLDSNHDLADNCQYWIGEVYYALNDYRTSIKEFEKVSLFTNSNKLDDAQYKIGLCYTNLGQIDRAKNKFKDLLKDYPNSEYYEKAKNYLQ